MIFDKLILPFLLFMTIFNCTSNKYYRYDNYPEKKVTKVTNEFAKVVNEFNQSYNRDTTITSGKYLIKIVDGNIKMGIKYKVNSLLKEIEIEYYSKGNRIKKVYIYDHEKIDSFISPQGIINEPW